MAKVPDTDTIIKVAKISQYLYDRAIYSSKFYNNQLLDERKPELIYLIRKDVEFVFNTNSSDPTLSKTGEYLFGLCSPFTQIALQKVNNSTQSPPIVDGPQNDSVNVGQTATFQVSVTSSLPVTYQWYRNGIAIPNANSASYVVSNAQLSDSGSIFSVRVTNAAGTTPSNNASLIVNASILVNWWFGSTDPFPDLNNGIDNLTYQIGQTIVHNQPIPIGYPTGAQNNQFNVLRYPDTENDKTNWQNTTFNFGTIPDAIMRSIISFNGYKYIISRVSMSLDATQQTLIYSN